MQYLQYSIQFINESLYFVYVDENEVNSITVLRKLVLLTFEKNNAL